MPGTKYSIYGKENAYAFFFYRGICMEISDMSFEDQFLKLKSYIDFVSEVNVIVILC